LLLIVDAARTRATAHILLRPKLHQGFIKRQCEQLRCLARNSAVAIKEIAGACPLQCFNRFIGAICRVRNHPLSGGFDGTQGLSPYRLAKNL
jgi:hypothetical protein